MISNEIMIDALNSVAELLGATSLSALIAMRLWSIPLLQSLHILSLALVLASAVLIDLRILGVMAKGQPLSVLARRHLPVIWVALGGAALTGTLLLVAEPKRSLLAWPFQIKMVMLLTVIIITVTFQRVVALRAVQWDTAPVVPVMARVTAVISIVLWLAIILAGRWIAYI